MTEVIVAGGGIGGLTAAVALERAGCQVTVLEQAGQLREVGAGLQMAPNATRVFDRLGLAEPLAAIGTTGRMGGLRRWDDGSLLARREADGATPPSDAPHYQVYRPDLLDVLVGAFDPARLLLGRRVAAVVDDGRRVVVTCDDGTTVEADALIGADGVHSVVRELLWGPDQALFSGLVAYRGIAPVDVVSEETRAGVGSTWVGPERYFITYWVAQGALMNWVGYVRSDWTAESWSLEATLEETLADFADFDAQVGRMIEATPRLMRWGIFDRDPMPEWGRGRVSLLGDACHPMQPHLGQGACQAIEDGYVLGRCFEGVAADGVEPALRRYEDLRRDRTARVQLGARYVGAQLRLVDGDEQQARDARMSTQGHAGIFDTTWIFNHDLDDDLAATAEV